MRGDEVACERISVALAGDREGDLSSIPLPFRNVNFSGGRFDSIHRVVERGSPRARQPVKRSSSSRATERGVAERPGRW